MYYYVFIYYPYDLYNPHDIPIKSKPRTKGCPCHGSEANMAVGNSTAKLKSFFDEARLEEWLSPCQMDGIWMVYGW